MKIQNEPMPMPELTTGETIPCGPRPGARHGGPLPPHLRGGLMRLTFEQDDWQVLLRVFGDEDTAQAAAGILLSAPPEIQVLACQVMKLIREVE